MGETMVRDHKKYALWKALLKAFHFLIPRSQKQKENTQNSSYHQDIWLPETFSNHKTETRTRSFAQSFMESLFLERDRWILWLIVPFAVGIGLYFSLQQEPPVRFWGWSGPLSLLTLIYSWYDMRSGLHRGIILLILSLLMLGFSAAQYRTEKVAAPKLKQDIGPVDVRGEILRVDRLFNGKRFWIINPDIETLKADDTPFLVRITRRIKPNHPHWVKMNALKPGDTIAVLAKLTPPQPPVAPGAFNYPRHAWFQQLGGLGYALGDIRTLTSKTETSLNLNRLNNFIEVLRYTVEDKIKTILPAENGAVASALIVGARHAIPYKDLKAMRSAGLAHLLAISGLHMGLTVGFLFVTLRFFMALWPWLALHFHIKKIAAIIALCGGGAYLLLAGATVPTQRAFLMFAIMMLGVLVDRNGISMRFVIFAGFVVLFFTPESLLGPSFQLSFAAVIMLIAGYETLQKYKSRPVKKPGLHRTILFYIGAVLLSSLLAGLATAPFSLLHFSKIPLYGLLSNLIAMPIMAFWVMPWALFSMVIMPFGFADYGLIPMGWGIDIILKWSRWIADQKGAVLYWPLQSNLTVLLLVFGGLWLCFWQKIWRLLGFLPICLAMGLLIKQSFPDMLIARQGHVYGMRGEDGTFYMTRSGGRILRESWSRMLAVEKARSFSNLAHQNENTGLRCDESACVLKRFRWTVVVQSDPMELPRDCLRADFLFTSATLQQKCILRQDNPNIILKNTNNAIWDKRDLKEAIALKLFLFEDHVEIETVQAEWGRRPWTD